MALVELPEYVFSLMGASVMNGPSTEGNALPDQKYLPPSTERYSHDQSTFPTS